ncbi:hypothetical protein MJO29_009853 [Puccinia striiformis f. sp. tritici]|nr:hypothetical protein MJO29_009853 [Puccinia striiformis f. sp. tritici]
MDNALEMSSNHTMGPVELITDDIMSVPGTGQVQNVRHYQPGWNTTGYVRYCEMEVLDITNDPSQD